VEALDRLGCGLGRGVAQGEGAGRSADRGGAAESQDSASCRRHVDQRNPDDHRCQPGWGEPVSARR
jgi:hypothetical protein